MSGKSIKLFSTSTIHGSTYLGYCESAITDLFQGCSEVIFVPYARPGGISHDQYTDIARKKFEELGFSLKGLHEFDDPKAAVEGAQGIFTGGGNTFLLLKTLYDLELVEVLKSTVNAGVPYMGTSAGSNMAGLTIGTTNDMPIVFPKSFNALQLLNLNINPHYLDPDPNSTHKGETRETRIKEFHFQNNQPVVGLREGSWLEFTNGELFLRGELKARIFRKDMEPEEFETDSNLSFLLH